MHDVIVKASPISGKGVFSAREFKRGDIVITWNPRTLSEEEFDALPERERAYVEHIDGKHLLMGIPERFVNHSCDPNTRAQGLQDVASRDIRAGEEITTDYAHTAPTGWTMKCDCGSEKCRGIIRSTRSA